MKYIFFIVLLAAGIIAKAQAKGDTTKYRYTEKDTIPFGSNIQNSALVPSGSLFDDIVFLLQQNKKLSDRLDRAEKRMDTLATTEAFDFLKLVMKSWTIDSLRRKIDSLEHRPYLQFDTKTLHPALLVLCPDGSCGIILRKF